MRSRYGNSWAIAGALLACLGAAPFPARAQQPPSSEPAEPPIEQTEAVSLQEGEDLGLGGILSGASGVRVATMCTNCNVANVTMFGQTGDIVQVWQDGLPVVGGLGAIYLLSVLPIEAVAKTEIVRGAGSVLTGAEASVGGLFLETKTPRDPGGLFVQADAGSLDSTSFKLAGSGTIGAVGGGLVYTYGRADGSDPNGDGVYDLGSFRRNTLGGTLTWQIADRSFLRAEALDYEEEQRDSKGGYAGSPLPPGPVPDDEVLPFHREDIDIDKRDYMIEFRQDFRGGSSLTVGGRRTTRDQDTADETSGGEPYMTVDEQSEVATVRYRTPFLDRHILTVGADWSDLDVDGTTVKRSAVFPNGQSISDRVLERDVFAEIDFSLPAQINLTVGLLYDYLQLSGTRPLPSVMPGPTQFDEYETSESRILPRVRFAWKATRWLAVNLSGGDALSAPRPIFERVCCGALVLGNADVQPQFSRNYLLDLDIVPETWIRIRPAVFYSSVENFIQKVVWAAFPNYIPSYTQVNYPDVTVEGGELALEFRFFDRLSFGAQGSHVRTRAAEDLVELTLSGTSAPLFSLPGGRIPYIPEDSGSAFVKWDDPKSGLQFLATAMYTGSMLIQRLDNFFSIGVDDFEETPSFWLYNVRGQARVWKGLSIYAGVDNIGDYYQEWLNDPRFEYNWGPLRGRYYYGGLLYEM